VTHYTECEHFIIYAEWLGPTDPVVWAYTYTIPQFVVGSIKLESVPLPEGSILDLGVNALISTGGLQPVTYATIYAITHFNTLNPCPLITVCHQ
jgi:hypothetical protein